MISNCKLDKFNKGRRTTLSSWSGDTPDSYRDFG